MHLNQSVIQKPETKMIVNGYSLIIHNHPFLDVMREQGKNIPFTGTMMRRMEKGFTATAAFYPKKPNFKNTRSKYF